MVAVAAEPKYAFRFGGENKTKKKKMKANANQIAANKPTEQLSF